MTPRSGLSLLASLLSLLLPVIPPCSASMADKLAALSGSLSRLDSIRTVCGQLCRTDKTAVRGDFLDTVTAQVDCDRLFQSDILENSIHCGDQEPPKDIPPEMWEAFTMAGRVDSVPWYFNSLVRNTTLHFTKAEILTKEYMDKLVSLVEAGTPRDSYAYMGEDGQIVFGSALIDAAVTEVGVSGLTVLVIGTMLPWLEAVLLARGAARVVTVDFAYKISEHPDWEWLRPADFRRQYLEGRLPLFDRVFSYSSVEHSGLGRYGDALNPWGDIMTIAQAWCVSSKEARLVLGVPTDVERNDGTPGHDRIMFNAGRIYGPLRYPFLTTNWVFEWPKEGAARQGRELQENEKHRFQPVFVFRKINEIEDV